jgi:hypothetical protein
LGAQGTSTINFGSFPGTADTSVTVTGQASILAGSLVEAWIIPTATGDHSADEHWVDPPRVMAGNVVAGTGFTIYATSRGDSARATVPADGRRSEFTSNPALYGQWTVAWVWN